MTEKPSIIIGKNGVTPELIEEIKKQLNKSKEIKIKSLRSAREKSDRKKIAQEVAQKVKADLKEVRGFTFTLSKKR